MANGSVLFCPQFHANWKKKHGKHAEHKKKKRARTSNNKIWRSANSLTHSPPHTPGHGFRLNDAQHGQFILLLLLQAPQVLVGLRLHLLASLRLLRAQRRIPL